MSPPVQVALIHKNYTVAIGILAVLALTGATLMHWAGRMQSGAVTMGALSSQQAQAYLSVMSANRAVLEASSEPGATDEQLQPLRDELAEASKKLAEVNSAMTDLIDDGETHAFSGIPITVVDIYREQPHRLEYWLDYGRARASDVSRYSLRELSYQHGGAASIDIAFHTSDKVVSGLEAAIREVAAATKARALQLERIQIGLALTTLLTLAAEVGFIFGPLVRRLTAEHRRAEEKTAELREMAFRDGLTGLPNRLHFHKLLETAVPALAEGGGFAVVLCDLNRFKSINDSFGAEGGDALLIEVTRRISGCLSSGDVAARFGGDEFAVLAQGVGTSKDLMAFADRLRDATSFTWHWNGFDIDVSTSVGGVLCLSPLDAVDRLIVYADRALCQARSQELRTFVIGTPQRLAEDEAAAITREVPRALSAGEFQPFYQPKVDIATRTVVGVEALARWIHPERGLISPAVFIPAVHRAGRMADLTRFMLERAGRDARAWIDAGLPVRQVAVNMPEALLASRTGLHTVKDTLERYDLEGSVFTLEITEDVLVSRAADTIQEVVAGLADLGARIAFDDFGTGFASLSHLREFTFHELKIDKSFVAQIGRSEANEQIVRSMIHLAKGLDRKVVAEGVETADQLRFLSDLGCDVAQGYFFAKPMADPELRRWLDRFVAENTRTNAAAARGSLFAPTRRTRRSASGG